MIQSEVLIQKLMEQTRQIINQTALLKNKDLHALTWKENSHSWSILECLEHLNLYGDFYLPQIKNKISESQTKATPNFKSGILGNYFANSMLPKEKLNAMKTFKDKNPIHSNLNISVFDRFMNQQMTLLDLLNLSRNVNLNSVKISTSISKLIKLKLGDTFQFIINHNLRHFAQIDRIQKAMQAEKV